MPVIGAVRSILDKAREDAEEQRRAFLAKEEAKLLRQWGRLGDAPAEAFAALPTGLEYERARLEAPSLRPTTFAQQPTPTPTPTLGAPPPMEFGLQPTGLEALAQGFAPQDLLEQQALAFQGITPRQAGGAAAQEFFDVAQPDQFEALRQLALEADLAQQAEMLRAQGGPVPIPTAPPELRPLPQPPGPGLLGGLNQQLNAATGLLAGEVVGGVNPLANAIQLARLTGEQSGIPVLGGIPSGPEAQAFAGERGPLGLLEAEVEFGRPVTEPIGRFLGRGVGAQLEASPAGPLAAAAGVDLSDVGADVGGVAGPEALVLSNLVPIPFIDPLVLKLGAKLTRGLPIVVRAGERFIARDSLGALRNRLLSIAADPVTDVATKQLAEEAAEQAVRQAPVEQVTPRIAEFGGPIGEGLEQSKRGLIAAPADRGFRFVPAADGESVVRQVDGIRLIAKVKDGSTDVIIVSIGSSDLRVVGAGPDPSLADMTRLRAAILDLADANPGKQMVADAVNPKVRRLLLRLGAEEVPTTAGGRLTIPVDRLRRQPVEAAPAVRPAPAEAAPPPPVAGGQALTAEQVMARQGPEAAADAIATNPGREAREAWRLYSGAQAERGSQRAAWKLDQYALAKQSDVPIVKDAITPPNDRVTEMFERMFQFERGAVGRARVGSFRPEERPLVQALYDRVDNATVRLIEADPEFAPFAMADYFPHLFKVTKPKGRGGAGFRLRPGFKEERKLEGTLGDILNARPDLDLATWDPVDFVAQHEAAIDNYIASLEAIHGLRARGVIRPAAGAPANWRTPDVSPFKVRQKLQGWVAEPKAATTLEQMFGRSAFDQHGALKALKATREGLFKIKVFGGLFQGIDYTFRDVGLGLSELARLNPRGAVKAWVTPVKAVARAAVPAVDRAATRAAAKSVELQALYRNGLVIGDPSISDNAIRGLGGIVPQTIGGRQIPGARGLQQVVEYMSGGAYKKFHQGTIEQSGLVMLEKELRRGFPLEEAARRAVEETNVFFSSIPNWQSAVKSSTGRDLLKFPFFATGELEGWFRLPFQAPAGFAGIIGATVIMAEMMNKAFTGKWLTPEQLVPYNLDSEELAELRKGPQAILKTGVPGVDYNTRFLRPELPWKGSDGRAIYLDLLGQADTPFRFALDPMFAISTRLGQFPRAAIDLSAVFHGERPAFGERVESPQDFATFAAQQVAPISISGLAGTERGRIGVAGAGIQVGGLNISSQRLSEIRDELVETENAAGNLVGQYDKIPPDRLDPTDRAFMEQKYPELFVEPGEAFSQDTLAGVREGERRALRFADIDSAKVARDERFDNLVGEARGADASEQGIRRNLEELGNSALSDYRARTEPLFDELFPEAGEAGSQFQRLAQQYREISERHARRFTAADPGEAWDAFQREFDNAFSEEEQAILRREFGVNDAAWERARSEMTRTLRPYYELPEGSSRERWRRGNATGDAILWALGRTSCVQTGAHRSQAREVFNQLYGETPSTGDVDVCGRGGRSRGRGGRSR